MKILSNLHRKFNDWLGKEIHFDFGYFYMTTNNYTLLLTYLVCMFIFSLIFGFYIF